MYQDVNYLDELMLLINSCDDDDLDVNYDAWGGIDIIVNDCTDDYEQDREYNNKTAIKTLREWLDNNCNESISHFSIEYYFNDFMVYFAYKSYEM